MSTATWSRSETELLIKLLQEHPEIYDCTNKNYSKTYLKESAYAHIVEQFPQRKDFNITVVKKKIRTLRTQLSAEKKKMRSISGMGADEAYVPKLWCFDQLKFLLDADPETPSESNLDLTYSSDQDTDMIPDSPRPKTKRTKKANKKSVDVHGLLEVAEKSFAAVENMRNAATVQKAPSKSEQFCNYLRLQLDDLTTSFDVTTQKLLSVVVEAKQQEAPDRQMISQQLIRTEPQTFSVSTENDFIHMEEEHLMDDEIL